MAIVSDGSALGMTSMSTLRFGQDEPERKYEGAYGGKGSQQFQYFRGPVKPYDAGGGGQGL